MRPARTTTRLWGSAAIGGRQEIKRAYRKLARELHPDLNPDPATQERFKDVTAAYEVLSDPEKRRMYDSGIDPLHRRRTECRLRLLRHHGRLLRPVGPRGPRPRRQRGQDALVRVQVDLDEVVFGSDREIALETAVACASCEGAGTAPGTEVVGCTMCDGRGEIQQVQRSFLGQVMTTRACPQCRGFGTLIPLPCPECSGDGRVRTRRTLGFRIPPGVETGTRIQLSGEGEVGTGAGPAGDLYIEIVERPHPVFRRQGDDLHCTVAVPMTAAALGAEVPLDTLDGEELIRVPPGTQSGTSTPSGTRRPAPAGGRPRRPDCARGRRTPTRLDAEQTQLLEQLAALRGEEKPQGTPVDHHPPFFTRLKDAFSGK